MKCVDIFLTLVFGSIAPQTPGWALRGNDRFLNPCLLETSISAALKLR